MLAMDYKASLDANGLSVRTGDFPRGQNGVNS